MPIAPHVLPFLAALPSAAGRTALVTGGNAGLGRETARFLAHRGASVIIAARDYAKAEEARADVLSDVPDADVRVERLDLASLASVEACAGRLGRREIDIVVCNAGIMAVDRSLTEDGLESQLGVNHLGHFALVGRLYERLAARPGARVVVVTSSAAYFGRLDFDDLMGERRYDRWTAYNQAKLANVTFVQALARRFASAGAGVAARGATSAGGRVAADAGATGRAEAGPRAQGREAAGPGAPGHATAHAAHPGIVFTQLQRRLLEEAQGLPWRDRMFLGRITPSIGQDAQMGALPQVYAALSPDAENGDMWAPRWFVRGRPVSVRPPRAALDVGAQERLWAVSEELTGVAFGPRG